MEKYRSIEAPNTRNAAHLQDTILGYIPPICATLQQDVRIREFLDVHLGDMPAYAEFEEFFASHFDNIDPTQTPPEQ